MIKNPASVSYVGQIYRIYYFATMEQTMLVYRGGLSSHIKEAALVVGRTPLCQVIPDTVDLSPTREQSILSQALAVIAARKRNGDPSINKDAEDRYKNVLEELDKRRAMLMREEIRREDIYDILYGLVNGEDDLSPENIGSYFREVLKKVEVEEF